MFGRKTRARLASRLAALEKQATWTLPDRIQAAERNRVSAVGRIEARLQRIEPAVFPDAARAQLAKEIRYVAPDMSDDEVTAIFRARRTED